ncbi:RING-H2 finger protein ATL46-like [Olea europaea var. sylvestris]|uniref:RING-H2 finger protein ATL46-like n=1 Tax=Olea europaea var. sylvestris TaxID=158386 RepID=UPI000C1D3C0B|nr:RING-H2 finger protein ATL46-like [Olea europaea var. sylvestris]XP_022871174.1 RING-H2 finger protein ATL46-like [Olea europaea var. sylvestris]
MRGKGIGRERVKRQFSEHMHLKMSWIQHQINQKDGVLTYQPPVYPVSASPYVHNESSPSPSSSGTRISPVVLFIIVILAVLFFVSGLLHLLVRFLTKNSSSSQSNRDLGVSGSDVLQRQLQQLFHLHDSGLDQAFIDALPVFMYKEIEGSQEPFDCAVCLSEFSEKDQLRLLPICSHAFHINCIDTWLLTNSTCPLCRGTLFNPGFPTANPIFDYDDFREEDRHPTNVENRNSFGEKTAEIEEVAVEKAVLPVRLGKFRKLNEEEGESPGESSDSKLDVRRCYSMGSYQYVVGGANLRIPLSLDRIRSDAKLVKGTEQISNPPSEDGKKISIGTRTDSYSVSKIWLWSKKSTYASSSDAQMEYPSSLNMDLP